MINEKKTNEVIANLNKRLTDLEAVVYQLTNTLNHIVNKKSGMTLAYELQENPIAVGSLNDVFATKQNAANPGERENKICLCPPKITCIDFYGLTGKLGIVRSPNSKEFISKYDY